jgi:hypothetical protein
MFRLLFWGASNMSYDFKRNHHIGMTPEGYHDGNRTGAGYRPRNTGRISHGNGNWQTLDFKPMPECTGPFVNLSTHDLRQLCFAGDKDAIAEYEYRHINGKF